IINKSQIDQTKKANIDNESILQEVVIQLAKVLIEVLKIFCNI
ncbi:10598_t:CDS:1, partial [Gigaspora margarita]